MGYLPMFIKFQPPESNSREEESNQEENNFEVDVEINRPSAGSCDQ